MGLSEEAVVRRKAQKKAEAKAGEVKGFLEVLNRICLVLNKTLAWISGCSLLLIVLLVVLNGVLRAVDCPLSGTMEIVGWLGAVSTSFALGYTQLNRGHVDIDILTRMFPSFMQRTLKILMLLLSAAFFTMMAWQTVVFGLRVAAEGNVSETLSLPFYPLIFLMALGLAGFSAVLLVEMLNNIWGRADR